METYQNVAASINEPRRNEPKVEAHGPETARAADAALVRLVRAEAGARAQGEQLKTLVAGLRGQTNARLRTLRKQWGAQGLADRAADDPARVAFADAYRPLMARCALLDSLHGALTANQKTIGSGAA